MDVNDPIRTMAELWALPVGSTVEYERNIYIKEPDGFWQDRANGSMNWLHDATLGRIRVASIGAVQPLNYAEFCSLVTTLSVSCGILSSVAGVPEALRDLDLDLNPPLRLNMFVHPSDRDLFGRLPRGSVLHHGDPRTLTRQSLAVKDVNGYAIPLTGSARPVTGSAAGCARLVSVPEGTALSPWPEPESPEREAEKIQTLRRRLWEVGSRYKSAQGWCGTFEGVMSRIQVDASILATVTETEATIELSVGQTLVTSEFDGQLPDGTILRWVNTSDDGDWAWYIVDRSNGHGALNTRYLAGLNHSHHSLQMEVVALPGQMDPVPIRHYEAAGLPVGSIITAGTANVPREKVAENRWVWPVGSADGVAIGEEVSIRNLNSGSNVFLVHMPGHVGPSHEAGVAVASHEQMRYAPLGSLITQGLHRWVKDGVDHWTNAPDHDGGLIGASHHFMLGANFAWTRWGSVAEPVTPQHGAVVASHVQMVAAPVGSTVMQYNARWLKRGADEWWTLRDGVPTHLFSTTGRSDQFILSDTFQWDQYGPDYSQWPQGEQPTSQEQQETAPEGMMLAYVDTPTTCAYRKVGDRWVAVNSTINPVGHTIHHSTLRMFVWLHPTTNTGEAAA